MSLESVLFRLFERTVPVPVLLPTAKTAPQTEHSESGGSASFPHKGNWVSQLRPLASSRSVLLGQGQGLGQRQRQGLPAEHREQGPRRPALSNQ